MQAMARTRAANGNFKPNDDYEKMQFYYHPDHLGSTSYITNLDGEVSQHIEYVPFGEVFIEERNNTWNTPYLVKLLGIEEIRRLTRKLVCTIMVRDTMSRG